MSEVAIEPLPYALTRPIHIAEVGLKSRDPAALAQYYRDLLGLETLADSGSRIDLGAGGVRLLSLERLAAGVPGDDPRSAGLFHTAFLMPNRADLGRWIMHVADKRIPIDGASDHLVSEALYLTDPEGNGIEVYADRPHEGWAWDDGQIRMGTERLDIPAVVAAAGSDPLSWKQAPEHLGIGHVHLRVGNPGAATKWWTEEVGMSLIARMPSAAFLASGGYHHHIGANSWQSANAGKRDPNRSGLAYVTLAGSGVTAEKELADPWGTVIRLQPS